MDLFVGSGVLLIASSITYGLTKLMKKEGDSKNSVEVEQMKVDYIFSKSGRSIKNQILQLIDNSQKTLDVAIYTLTDKEVISRLCHAANRGVKVRLITDKECTRKFQSQASCVQQLINDDIPVKINIRPNEKMHLKLMISDKENVATGSYNYTKAAQTMNDEVVFIINNKRLAVEWSEVFETRWNNSESYFMYNESPNTKSA